MIHCDQTVREERAAQAARMCVVQQRQEMKEGRMETVWHVDISKSEWANLFRAALQFVQLDLTYHAVGDASLFVGQRCI